MLDLATGTAIVAVLAARAVGAGGNVIGVDISPGMLDQARKKIRVDGLQNVELIEADAEKLDFEAESFDAILLLLRILFHDSSFGQGLRQV